MTDLDIQPGKVKNVAVKVETVKVQVDALNNSLITCQKACAS